MGTGNEEEMKVSEIPESITIDNKENIKYHIVGWNPYGAHKPIYEIEKYSTPVIRK